jgi:hypothetical protein
LPHAKGWLLLDPEGQKNPAVHGPLHLASLWRSAQPKRPAGHRVATPSTQYQPLGQGATATRVLGPGPIVSSPGRAGTGAPLPSGQYTAMEPQATCWADVEFVGQKKPGAHLPEHVGVARPREAPNVPAGQLSRTPPSQYDPGGQGTSTTWCMESANVAPGNV